ncbi:hypothetical protein ABZ250_24750 [Streptomyces afghaniensis]|uniref:hypothetical protein n=1 Tax=Streptomyces afghaniensis TaxID=66865 RepID=UPI0033A37D17
MSVWKPTPEETLLARVPVTFATGAAMRVKGRRWFRDTERNDIQHELDGWPEGPTQRARSTGGAVAWSALRGAALAVGVLFMAFISAFGGNLSGASSRSGTGSSNDPADEIEDFPVMWAAPGTIARTLPWQLDPARSQQKRYRTHLIVTDRRLVVVGTPFSEREYKRVDGEVLWETPRATVGKVERRDFKDGDDVKVVFTDGSWCRLRTSGRDRLMRYMVDRLDFVPLDSLTSAQGKAAEDFASAHAPDAEPPVVTRSEDVATSWLFRWPRDSDAPTRPGFTLPLLPKQSASSLWLCIGWCAWMWRGVLGVTFWPVATSCPEASCTKPLPGW